MIEKIGVKLVSDFTEKLIDFITETKDNSCGENNDNGTSFFKIGSSGIRKILVNDYGAEKFWKLIDGEYQRK